MNYKFLFFISIIFLLSCNSKHSELDSGLYAEIKSNKGDIIIKLEYEKTPITVANFVSLAEGKNDYVSEEYKNKKYYDGIYFHRVISDFMIQTGDPTKTGSGGPGYKFEDEITDLTHYKPGILSMANAGINTNGSQFFITHKATPWLDGKHTVFGEVIKGQNVVDSIEQNDIIEKLSIIKKGKEAKMFNAPKVISNYFEEKEKIIEKRRYEEEELIKNIVEEMTKTSSGLWYKIIKNSIKPKPKNGEMVKVHYTGMLLNGEVFDSSYSRNMPIEFVLGSGRVIKGWDEGISLIPIGASAKLVIPSDLAYGERGAGGVIPPNSTLIFEIEVIDSKK